jgi:IS30 family transposase
MNPYVHPSIDERLRIYQFFRDGLSQAEIARCLSRDKATISRELRRTVRAMICLTPWRPSGSCSGPVSHH